MLEHKSIDVVSLKVVFEELNKTLLSASHNLEAFVAGPDLVVHLEEANNAIKQVSGVLKMLDLSCAYDLSHHLNLVLEQLVSSQVKNKPFVFKSAGHALVGLVCYLEYLMDTAKSCPPLILPFINELRAALNKPLILESEASDFSVERYQLQPIKNDQQQSNEDLIDLFMRMRAMYQTGLVGLIYEENVHVKIELMHRAMSRLSNALSFTPARTLWRLAEAVLEGLLAGNLELTFTRKRVLSMLDSSLRSAISQGDVLQFFGRQELVVELVYLVSLSSCQHEASKDIMSGLSVQVFKSTDQHLQGQRAIMQGPNAQTVEVMVSAVMQDLQMAKGVMEAFAENTDSDHDFTELLSLFKKIKNILTVVGALESSQLLQQLCLEITAVTGKASKEELLSMANSLLHVESLLDSLTRMDLHNQAAVGDNILEKKQLLMNRSQLKGAEKQLIIEALKNLNLAKQSFNSFFESDYSPALIKEIIEYINGVKGALDMLGHGRAAATLLKTIDCLLGVRDNDSENNNVLFQGIADTLIALEYYLTEIQDQSAVPVSALKVAEQSINAIHRQEISPL